MLERERKAMSKKSKIKNTLAAKHPTEWTFADIIAPITTEEFFRDYFGKKFLHIPGAADKFKNVMTWDILTDLLNMSSIWSSSSLMLSKDRNLVTPEEYCVPDVDRSGNNIMLPKTDLVMEKLHEGATLVCNDLDALNPGLRGIAGALEKAFNGKSQANLYCSSRQRQAFQTHFDTHDVFAMHMEGEKVWRVFSGLEDHPIRHPASMKTEVKQMQDRGETYDEIALKPGDFLYLPRGLYHDALSSTEGCIHIAFGVTGYIGMDVLSTMGAALVHNSKIRENLPRLSEGRAAIKAHITKIAEEITKTITSDNFINATMNHMENFHFERGGFDLPLKAEEIHYQTTSDNFSVAFINGHSVLKNDKQGIPIPPHLVAEITWIVHTTKFNRNDFTEYFHNLGIEVLDKMLTDLQNMKVIKQL